MEGAAVRIRGKLPTGCCWRREWLLGAGGEGVEVRDTSKRQGRARASAWSSAAAAADHILHQLQLLSQGRLSLPPQVCVHSEKQHCVRSHLHQHCVETGHNGGPDTIHAWYFRSATGALCSHHAWSSCHSLWPSSGSLARGTYTANLRFLDDDAIGYLDVNYSFQICKDW